jgi:hypothetical protein
VLEFPRAGVDGLWQDESQAAAEMKEAAVLELFRQKRISIRRGAELLGLTYRGFLDLASRHQNTLFSQLRPLPDQLIACGFYLDLRVRLALGWVFERKSAGLGRLEVPSG